MRELLSVQNVTGEMRVGREKYETACSSHTKIIQKLMSNTSFGKIDHVCIFFASHKDSSTYPFLQRGVKPLREG